MEIVNPYVDNLRKLLCCLLASVRGTTGIEDTKTRPLLVAIAAAMDSHREARGVPGGIIGVTNAWGAGSSWWSFSCCEMPALHSAFLSQCDPLLAHQARAIARDQSAPKNPGGEAKGEAQSELQYDPPGTHHPGEARGDTQEGADRGLGRGLHCAVERGRYGDAGRPEKRLDLRMSSSFKVGLGVRGRALPTLVPAADRRGGRGAKALNFGAIRGQAGLNVLGRDAGRVTTLAASRARRKKAER